MSKAGKIGLIIAASLVLVGGVIFAGTMAVLKWDLTKLSTVSYETKDYVFSEDYKNISVLTDTADIVFTASETANSTVTCYEHKNTRHTVAVKDGALVIESVDTRKWYEYIGISFGTPKLTIAIPQGEYGVLTVRAATSDVTIPNAFRFESVDVSVSTGDVTTDASVAGTLSIHTSTGHIGVQNASAGEMELAATTGRVTVSDVTCDGEVAVRVSTGKTQLTDVACRCVTSSGDTGDISLKSVVATERIDIERDTGDVRFDGCDAGEISVETDTGDVTGTLLSEKVFIVETDTGRTDVPKTATGGRCEITTDTGDIRLKIQQ